MHHTDHVVPDQPRPLPDGALYFVGIGGAGMSAIAQVLAERGRRIAGADPGIAPAVRERLERAGVQIFTQHDARQLEEGVVAVVVSDAIPAANPEVQAAQERGIPIFRRPEVLGAIVNAGRGIAIAGTHGKTTTTGMVASILLAAGLDPTILIGGDLPAIGGNAHNGTGEFVVAEACEAYDGFLYLHPEVAVVLNVEADHLDYHGTEEHVIRSFERFVSQVKRPGGSVILNKDDECAVQLWESVPPDHSEQWGRDYARGFINDTEYRRVVCYSLDGEWPITAWEIEHSQSGSTFVLWWRRSDRIGPWDRPRVNLKVPGRHNVGNALAAVAAARTVGIRIDKIVEGLEAFTGTGRRFERLGEVGGVLIVDDYAHHPTEIRATLAAARSSYPDRRLAAVFQPHLPSRTRDQMDGFAEALSAADMVFLTDIYLAREQPIEGVSSAVLADRIHFVRPGVAVEYVADKGDLPDALAAAVHAGDIVLTLGAGDIRRVGEALKLRLTAAAGAQGTEENV
jgi:UDP-N-acetylmuramate--alanine ligase